jgi:hypothetical protein
MTELRNLRKLHAGARTRIAILEEENKLLKTRVMILEGMVRTYEATQADLKLQVEELRTMVFGRKKRVTNDDEDPLPPPEKTPRPSDSYRRPVPTDAEVTDTEHHPLLSCIHCQGTCTKTKILTYYVEDIPLPVQKTITKHLVEKGYCPICAKWCTAVPLPTHTVMLGLTAQKYLCYLIIVCRLSYAQTQQLLKDTFSFAVSQGEIAKILARQAVLYRPEYEQLKVRIRGEPCVGLDETGWQLHDQGEHTYAWVMTGMKSTESVYLLGESRGGDNVDTLLGKKHQGYVVTDDFGGYHKLGKHQLCWAHLIRKFRDLSRSKELPEPAHISCVSQYTQVAELFADIARNRDQSERDAYTQRLRDLAVILPSDGLKLQRIKKTLQKNIPLYLTCLADPSIPLTNNQSERSLRHLVLKRKISFGSLKKQTAETTAILLSILLSRRARDPENYVREWVGV